MISEDRIGPGISFDTTYTWIVLWNHGHQTVRVVGRGGVPLVM